VKPRFTQSAEHAKKNGSHSKLMLDMVYTHTDEGDEAALVTRAQQLLAADKSQRVVVESEPRTATEFAARITACCRRSVEAIIEAGRLLTWAKAALPHGEFKGMVESQLPFKLRAAEMLMAIHRDPRLVNAQYVAHLPPTTSTLYELTRLSDEAFQARIADGTIRPDMERRDISVTIKRERRQERERELAAAMLALPDKRYGIILADWPRKPSAWSEETGFDRAPDNHYVTQTFRWAIDELAPMLQGWRHRRACWPRGARRRV
jgi:Protein of unknown function (DUF3102)